MASPPVTPARPSAAPTPGAPTSSQTVPSAPTATSDTPSVSPVSVMPEMTPSTRRVAAPSTTVLMPPVFPKHIGPSSGCVMQFSVPPDPTSAT